MSQSPILLRVVLWALVMGPFVSGGSVPWAPTWYMVYIGYVSKSRLRAHARGP